MFLVRPRPMVTHGHYNPFSVPQRLHFNRQAARRVEALGVAQQVVHGALDHGRPTLEGQLRLGFQVHELIG
ncbi:hypothetical protein D3C80_2217580 [compost metagenome]